MFGMYSKRLLLGLWQFLTRQRKQRVFFRDATCHSDGQFGEVNMTSDVVLLMSLQNKDGGIFNQYNWSRLFNAPSRLLVININYKMGVSLLGLATSLSWDDADDCHCADDEILLNWGGCNFIGVDLSCLVVGYVQSVQSRQGLGGCLTFVVESAEDCLARIGDSYQGQVALVMLQFPTPYRFQGNNTDKDNDDASGKEVAPSVAQGGFNLQLPEGTVSYRRTWTSQEVGQWQGPDGSREILEHATEVACLLDEKRTTNALEENDHSCVAVIIHHHHHHRCHRHHCA